MIKQRDVKLRADQVYLGQQASSHVLLGSSLQLPVCNRLCSMKSKWVIAKQHTTVL